MKIKLSQLRRIIREEVENAMATTTFECRLCGDTIQGEASPDGPGKVGWSSLAGIDGPSSVCPECAERVRQDASELDAFRDEYPNVRLAENSMVSGRCPKCRKSVRLTSNGLISYHDYVNPLGETQNCPGSQNEPA